MTPEIEEYIRRLSAPRADEGPGVADLEQIDKDKERSNALGYLGQVMSRSGSLVRGDKVGTLPAPPMVDDSVRKFILTRKMGAAQDPLLGLKGFKLAAEIAKLQGGGGADAEAPQAWGAQPGMTRSEALRAGYGRAPKQEKMGKTPITPGNETALRSRGIDPSGMDNDDAARLLGTQLVAGQSVGLRQSEIERDKTGDARMGRHMTLGPRSPLIGDSGQKAKFLDGAEAAMDLSNNSDKLIGLIDRYGTGRLAPEVARTQMQQLVATLRTSLKTIMQLGVIGGADMPKFIDPQIADPTLVEANFNEWFGSLGKTDYKTQLRGLKANFLGKTKRKMDLLDVIPEGPLARQLAKARADELLLQGMDPADIEKTLTSEGF